MKQFNRYFLDTIKNRYAKFDGRATRSEYWYFILFYFILALIVTLVDVLVINPMLGLTLEQAQQGGILQIIVGLGLLIPTLALTIRRLHDIGKSGWWFLIALIPIIGALVLIYFYVQDSQVGSNLYGENPKEI